MTVCSSGHWCMLLDLWLSCLISVSDWCLSDVDYTNQSIKVKKDQIIIQIKTERSNVCASHRPKAHHPLETCPDPKTTNVTNLPATTATASLASAELTKHRRKQVCRLEWWLPLCSLWAILVTHTAYWWHETGYTVHACTWQRYRGLWVFALVACGKLLVENGE